MVPRRHQSRSVCTLDWDSEPCQLGRMAEAGVALCEFIHFSPKRGDFCLSLTDWRVHELTNILQSIASITIRGVPEGGSWRRPGLTADTFRSGACRPGCRA